MDSISPNVFGLIIPGEPMITEFQAYEDFLFIDIPKPASITTIGLVLTTPLPDGFGGSLYYSIPPFENLEFIGAVGNLRPSDIFSTNFALNPNTNELSTLKLVLRVEPLENLKTLVELSTSIDVQKEFVKKVAKNLYNAMASYHKEGLIIGPEGADYLVIPSNFLERWLEKFEIKYRLDPNFILKTD
eukprot:TRINITY_DN1891_c0_g2_i1.p1 TRINITY_DN1891_c0_g2~~TRINITY_DN1891_c0_g2_i1.p1  ORF type:complete len:187 (+),score=42.20 TRINITY_DN1891_c0_g2_i1:98-658(+)